MTGLAFLDTETVTLEPGPDVIWEIGLILRDAQRHDEEWRWQIRPNLDVADAESLRISRFAGRFIVPDGELAVQWAPGDDPPRPRPLSFVAFMLTELLDKRHVIGAVPSFDTTRLSLFLRKHGYRDPWHYHLCDVENLAVGYIAGVGARAVDEARMRGEEPPRLDRDRLDPPWYSEALSRAVGVEPPGDEDRHTALGDARWARSIFDLVMGGERR